MNLEILSNFDSYETQRNKLNTNFDTIGGEVDTINENIVDITSDVATLNSKQLRANLASSSWVTLSSANTLLMGVTGVLPVANGGTGSTTGLTPNATYATTSGVLGTARGFLTNLANTSYTSFNGSANCVHGVTGILPIANGGTGNSTGVVASANKLTTARTFRTNLSATANVTFDGSANCTLGVTGILPVANGGTGNSNGTVASANKLTTARTFRTNLSATANVTFNGSANCTLGVTGTLPVANGGTGVTSLSALGNALSSYVGSSLTGATTNYATYLGITAKASTNSGTSLGYKANSYGSHSTSIGANSTATGSNSVTVGYSSFSDAEGTAMGAYSIAASGTSTAYGFTSKAVATGAVAIGSYSLANNSSATSIGGSTNASHARSTSLGHKAAAWTNNSTALGAYASASFLGSTAIGHYAVATGINTIQLGNATYFSAITSKVTSISSTSDEREKTDVSPILNSLDFLSKIDTVTYVFNHRADYQEDIDEEIIYLEEKRYKHQERKDTLKLLESTPEFIIDEESGEEVVNPEYSTLSATTFDLVEEFTEDDEEILSERKERREKRNMFGIYDYDREEHAKATKKRSRRRVGVKAQQVQEVMLDVYGTDNYADLVIDSMYEIDDSEIPEGVENTLAVNYSSFIPFLIDAVKELKTRVETLEAENESLRNQ